MKKSSAHASLAPSRLDEILTAYAKNHSLRVTEREFGVSHGWLWEITKKHAGRLAEIKQMLAKALPPGSEAVQVQSAMELESKVPTEHSQAATLQRILKESELSELSRCESVIKRGLLTFFEVGQALERIRDARLYRAEYKTFAEYCRLRWGISKTHANRQIVAADLANWLDDQAAKDLTEWDIRPLTQVPKEQAKSIWQKAKEQADTSHVPISHQILLATIQTVASPSTQTHRQKTPKPKRTVPDAVMRALTSAEAGVKAGNLDVVAKALRRMRAALERLAAQKSKRPPR